MVKKSALSPLDPSSFSRPELVKVTSIGLNLNVNFDKKVLSGTAELGVERVDKSINEIILDSLKLNIASIYDVQTKKPLKYELGEPLAEYGSKLTVQLPESDKCGCNYKIGIDYETSPEATGLQWLSPKATCGKKHPFLFSQFQPTHARSVIPCQDTPGVKTPYTATISAPQEFTVLMSAIRDGTKQMHGGKLSHFVQKVPMPSYLIALAVGDLESREIGPRSHVWSEREIIEECAYEFANTEHQLKTAEDLCGPYVWGIYDLLVLPPSFPYGGMENPCLTFVTPTLLAGDRSLANVIAHEIAHSWTGNLVTNRNFEHFWLNEGFTVFIERKIKGRLESPQSQDFDAYTHVTELAETINLMGKTSPLTNLVVKLDDVHPDDAFSIVPYEKGQTFLRYLETVVGGPADMEEFLRTYFWKYKYQSIDTDEFKKYFEEYFKDKPAIKEIDWQTWLYTPGMPIVIPEYDKTLVVACDEFIDKFVNWSGEGQMPVGDQDKEKLSTFQVIYILQKISEKPAQNIEKLKSLNALFDLDNVKNSEIKFRWLRICLKAHWEEKVDTVLSWINIVGRMKFVRPLYRDLYSWEKMRSRAIDNFKANRQGMMHVSAYTLAKDLHIDE
ncbi:leukotriene A-4 hydrolase [Anthonomus grandis grandis]|uniref:leukotriene A-4 hydrolase n=1 Tax=Anthonomus grandis grandis TaxID=2921223 RepID=UPI002165AB1D|nr:leukotriene A-4 hydrolase [Anthonomus grandis grandis]